MAAAGARSDMHLLVSYTSNLECNPRTFSLMVKAGAHSDEAFVSPVVKPTASPSCHRRSRSMDRRLSSAGIAGRLDVLESSNGPDRSRYPSARAPTHHVRKTCLHDAGIDPESLPRGMLRRFFCSRRDAGPECWGERCDGPTRGVLFDCGRVLFDTCVKQLL